MQPFRPYFSFLLLPAENVRKALNEYRALCWQEPDEADKLRDTVINRTRLEFYRRLYTDGRLSDT